MKIVFLRQAFKFVRRADEPLRNRIKEEILRIGGNPKIGKLLRGTVLKGIRSYRFKFAGVDYRIAYQTRGDLIVVYIASRENFYKEIT